MSTIIQIKRSNGAGAPLVTQLVEGELAYSEDSSNLGANGILYIGAIESGANVIHKLGGKYYTNLLDSATANATPFTLVRRDSTGFANVNVTVAGSANKWATARTITLAGDLSGSVSIDGSQDVTLYGNVVLNGVNLGSDTTGNYVANVLPGAGISVTNYIGETANLTVSLSNSGVTAGIYGNGTSFSTITIDSYGRITGASNVSLVTTNVAEGTNLYYNNTRVYGFISPYLTTANVVEVNNLYFTTGRARNSISVVGGGSYDNATGVITISGNVYSVSGATGAVSNAQVATGIVSSGLLTTSNVVEGTNLYYTNARVYGNVTQIGYAYISQVAVKANVVDLTTANVTELINLYYTNARVYANVISLLPTYTGNISTGNIIGLGGNLTIVTGNARATFDNTGNLTVGNGIFANALYGLSANSTIIAGQYSTIFNNAGNVLIPNAVITNVLYANVIQGATTSNLAEGNNLYFTNARVFANVIQLGYATNAYVDARLLTKANVVDLTTANVTELNNLYYTNARVYANVNQIGYAYISQVAVKANIVDLTTANVTELNNLYYTNARVYANVNQIGYAYISQVAVKANIVDLTTANVVENTNLYFTNARARTAISVAGNLSYSNTTGVITYTNPSPVVTVTLNGDVSGTASSSLDSLSSNTITISTTIQPNSVQLGVDTTGDYLRNVIGGTSIVITNQGGENAAPTISTTQSLDPSSSPTFHNLTLGGNLIVTGNLTYINTLSFEVDDPLIYLAGNNYVSDTVDIGFVGNYYDGNLQRHAGLFRDASDSKFKLFANLNPEPTNIIDTANASFRYADLYVNTLFGNVIGNVSTLSNHTTNNLAEGSLNLYYTNSRVYGNVTTIGYAYVSQVITKANIVDLTTANVTELTNLYYTNARVFANVIQLGYATNAYVDSRFITKANVADLTTANVAETTNLYYTNARVFANVIQLGYATNAYVDARLLTKANVADLTTSNVAEGTNLYFTNARSRSALSQGSGISYNSSTGVISLDSNSNTFLIGKLFDGNFTGDNTTTNFTLQFVAQSANAVLVFVDSILQSPGSDYSTSGNILTFTSPPETNASITYRYFSSQNINLNLANLGDVSSVVTPFPNSTLVYNGTFWVPTATNTIGAVTLVGGASGSISNTQLASAVSSSGILTTSNVIEGTNLYYTNARVKSYLSAFDGDIIPSVTGLYNLGSATRRWKDLFLYGNTIDLGGVTLASGPQGLNVNAANIITLIGNSVTVGYVTANVWNNLYTSNVIEGSNLYFTNARVYANIFPLLTTANISEVNNLYYTNTRVYSNAITSFVSLETNQTVTGAKTFSLIYASSNSYNFGTSISDGSIYYTKSSNTYGLTRGGGGGDVVTFQPTGITINGVSTLPKATGSVNTYLRADGTWATIYTSNVLEDTNLYYTNARVYANVVQLGFALVSQVTAKANVVDLTTSNVIEGTNLYFTNARARAALTSGNGISYNTTTGNITLSPTGVTSSTYGGSSNVPVITVDSYGRISSASNVAVAGVSSFTSSGNAFTITTSAGTSFIANIQLDSIRLGTDTTGNYVANVVPGTGLTGSGFGGEAATPTISLGTSGVTAGTYGTAAFVPQIVVDQYGRITSASNTAIATTLTIAGGTGTDTVNLISDTLTFAGTTNEIETTVTNNQVQIGLPDNVTIGNNLSVGGNLTVNGVVTTLNTAVSVVEDPLLKLGNGNPADILDLGFFGVYTSTGSKFAGLFRDASDSGKFKLFQGLQADPDSVPDVVDTAGVGYTRGILVADVTGGNIYGLLNPIAVASGGIGTTSLTTNSIMYPNTSSTFGFATGSAGHVLQLNNSGVPVFGNLDGGTY